MAVTNKVVAYYYDEDVGNFNDVNLMRPHRVRLAHNLIDGYGLKDKMLVHRPTRLRVDEMQQFHADEYIDFLSRVTPDHQQEFLDQMKRFNLGTAGEADCPVYDGMFEYFQIYTGGSVNGASIINSGDADIAVNWAGGAHHAKKAEASGFCYINDIVLAILELLKKHQRVLYVDIDIHHGDGVEEAFLETDRVMTVSFHKYGDFFPGTGALDDCGYKGGKYYCVNVPLQEGVDDESYRYVYEPVMRKVMELYQPGAVVVCSGADSLAGDRLGCFNLSLEGHSQCIEFLAKFNVPILVVGGGGYTMRNVSRCWCYETGRLVGEDLANDLPREALERTDYWLDTHKLRIMVSNMKNSNTREKLEHIKNTVLENLSRLDAAPSAAMSDMPPAQKLPELPEEDMDVRGGGAAYDDVRIDRDGYGSDAEVDSRSELSWRKQVGSPSPYRPQYKRSHVNIEAGDDDAGSSGVPSPSDIIATKRLQPSPPKSGAGQIAPQAEIAGADDNQPAGEYTPMDAEHTTHPTLADGTVINDPDKITAADVARATEFAKAEQSSQQQTKSEQDEFREEAHAQPPQEPSAEESLKPLDPNSLSLENPAGNNKPTLAPLNPWDLPPSN